MQTIVRFLPYIQIVLSVLLVAGILLQQSAAGLGGAFGDNFSSAFHTRRGFEKTVFNASIVLAILFVISAVASFLLK
jgi:preprotein translocase subunit SecG